MELSMSSVNVCDYSKRVNTEAAVDADIIVPDTKPDIYRILSVKANADVTERYMRKDKVIFSGKVKFNILYVGEDDKSMPCSIEYTTPFNHQTDMIGADDGALCRSECQIIKTGFDVRNSRKLSVSAKLDLMAEAVRTSSIEAVCSIEAEERIPSRYRDIAGDTMPVCKEVEFTVEDTVSLQQMEGENECVIYDMNVRPDIAEVKTVNNKAVVKGNAIVEIFYSCDRELQVYDTELPFTEIVDLDGMNGELSVGSDFYAADYEYAIDSDSEGIKANIQVKIKGSICGYAHEEYSIAEDLYSPDFCYELKTKSVSLMHKSDPISAQVTIKDSMVIQPSHSAAKKIYFMTAVPVCTSCETVESTIRLHGDIDTVILYMNEESELERLTKVIPFDIELPFQAANPDAEINARVTAVNFGYTFGLPNEIQARIVLKAECDIAASEEANLITGFEYDKKNIIDKSSQPSIVVYFPEEHCDLWNIAKKYNTTCEEIAQVNNLDLKNDLVKGKPILITKKQVIAQNNS